MVEEKEYKIEEAEENSDNKEFMIDAILHHASWVIAYASERLLSDKELMLEAVKADGQELYYASKELRDDKDVVLAAVTNKPLIIKYASKRLRGDRDVAIAALTNAKKPYSPESISIYLTENILKDPDVDLILHPPVEEESK